MTPSELANDLNRYGGTGFNIFLDTFKEWVFSIDDIGGFILGVVVILILVGMAIITCLDLSYITLPIARDGYDKLMQNKIKNQSLRFFKVDLVSKDAIESVKKGYNNSRSPILYYVKMRLKTYLFATFLILILIIGPNIVVKNIALIISGLLDIIRSIIS